MLVSWKKIAVISLYVQCVDLDCIVLITSVFGQCTGLGLMFILGLVYVYC